MSGWRKTVKKALSAGGTLIGAGVIFSPAITAVMNNVNSPQNIPNDVVGNYTGYNINNGQMYWDKTAQGIGTVVAGVVIKKLLSWASKSL